MSSPSPSPPDLKVLCRKLTSLSPSQLPHALPSLINHALRCKEVLSAPQDQKLRDASSETAHLIHKLKTSVNTLLNGRAKEGRFAAVGLIKAMVDVGGWETLRSAQPWVQGLQGIVQKADPLATKELAIITLTRIYVLVHPYQTLVREIATPTIPPFVTGCLQLLKSSPSLPSNVAETICESLSTLVPLYPPTFRPFNSKIKDTVKLYLAPTDTDTACIPQPLRNAARTLVISLHQVAAKSGGSEEWSKHVDNLIKEYHSTADQVFRAVHESWEPSGNASKPHVDLRGEACGCSEADASLPVWSGIQAGSQRLVGLSEYLSDYLSYPTQTAITVPLTALTELVSRVCSVTRQRRQTWDQALELNAAIGREEKEELWSVLPDIHIAVLRLLMAAIRRLNEEFTPLTTEILDHLNRIVSSHMALPDVREATYELLSTILPLAGSTLSKPTVDMLSDTMKACCRDLLEHVGFIKDQPETGATSKADTKKSNGTTANADLFLKTNTDAAVAAATASGPGLKHSHLSAATQLLFDVFSFIPQRFLKPSLRSLLDKTSIVTKNQEAMIASVLNPYKDQRGRMYPSILPHLTQLFPQSQAVEVLRSNLRTDPAQDNEAIPEGEKQEDDSDEEGNSNVDGDDAEKDVSEQQNPDNTELSGGFLPATSSKMDVDAPSQPNPFGDRPQRDPATASFGNSSEAPKSPPKRKLATEEEAPTFGKRQEREKPAASVRDDAPPIANVDTQDQLDASDGDDDESVHLTMDLDDIEGDSDED